MCIGMGWDGMEEVMCEASQVHGTMSQCLVAATLYCFYYQYRAISKTIGGVALCEKGRCGHNIAWLIRSTYIAV